MKYDAASAGGQARPDSRPETGFGRYTRKGQRLPPRLLRRRLPIELTDVLAVVLADEDPLRRLIAMFDPPTRRPFLIPDDLPVDLLDLAARTEPEPSRRVESQYLFECRAR